MQQQRSQVSHTINSYVIQISLEGNTDVAEVGVTMQNLLVDHTGICSENLVQESGSQMSPGYIPSLASRLQIKQKWKLAADLTNTGASVASIVLPAGITFSEASDQ